MATTIYGRALPARNGLSDPAVPAKTLPLDEPLITPMIRETLIMTADVRGGTTLGALAAALPGCARPISAVLALVDEGVLDIDLVSPFDDTCRVRTAQRPRP